MRLPSAVTATNVSPLPTRSATAGSSCLTWLAVALLLITMARMSASPSPANDCLMWFCWAADSTFPASLVT